MPRAELADLIQQLNDQMPTRPSEPQLRLLGYEFNGEPKKTWMMHMVESDVWYDAYQALVGILLVDFDCASAVMHLGDRIGPRQPRRPGRLRQLGCLRDASTCQPRNVRAAPWALVDLADAGRDYSSHGSGGQVTCQELASELM